MPVHKHGQIFYSISEMEGEFYFLKKKMSKEAEANAAPKEEAYRMVAIFFLMKTARGSEKLGFW